MSSFSLPLHLSVSLPPRDSPSNHLWTCKHTPLSQKHTTLWLSRETVVSTAVLDIKPAQGRNNKRQNTKNLSCCLSQLSHVCFFLKLLEGMFQAFSIVTGTGVVCVAVIGSGCSQQNCSILANHCTFISDLISDTHTWWSYPQVCVCLSHIRSVDSKGITHTAVFAGLQVERCCDLAEVETLQADDNTW